jgi:hypothetical protein
MQYIHLRNLVHVTNDHPSLIQTVQLITVQKELPYSRKGLLVWKFSDGKYMLPFLLSIHTFSYRICFPFQSQYDAIPPPILLLFQHHKLTRPRRLRLNICCHNQQVNDA